MGAQLIFADRYTVSQKQPKTKTIPANVTISEHFLTSGRSPGRLINLATQRPKDITAHLSSGEAEACEVPHNIGGVYFHQLVKKGQEEVDDARTGAKVLRWQEGVSDNHAWDCEYYQTAAATIFGSDFRTVSQN